MREVDKGGTGTMMTWQKATVSALVAGLIAVGVPAAASSAGGGKPPPGQTTTPIQHLVVIFQENVSFDHYFGTYPKAANTSGQPFDAARKTPTVNGLDTSPGAGG